MSNIIKPTIGRKVWYRHDGNPTTDIMGGMLHPIAYSDQPMDATVIYVWGDRMVNLRIVDHAGNAFSLASITLVQEGDATPGGCYCEWMPYQQGQARKEAPIHIDASNPSIPPAPAVGFVPAAEYSPAVAPKEFGVASSSSFSLDDDKPLSGGVCDMSAGCEACQ